MRLRRLCGVTGVALIGVMCATDLPGRQEKSKTDKSVGFIASAEASAKEVGLPLYPRARPHKDDSEDSPATQLGLWGGAFGFKLVVLKMESNDSPDKIASFYRKALGKYGVVLNCSGAATTPSEKDKSKPSKALDCGNDKPDDGGVLFKAGTKEKQHIVGITPRGQGSVFQLLYVEARGGD
jgi:hypothetical protein